MPRSGCARACQCVATALTVSCNVMTSVTHPRGCHPPSALWAHLLGHHPRAQGERPMSSEVGTHHDLGLCWFGVFCPLFPPSLSLNHKQLGETMK